LIEQFVEHRVFDRVKEAEVDALFTHFLKECDLVGYNVKGDYWLCVDETKKNTPASLTGGYSTLDFYEEVKKNAILKERFLNRPKAAMQRMCKQIMHVIECEKSESKFPDLFAQHREMNITDEEFDEFILLFFRMCAPTPQYLTTVWYNIVKIKKAMIPKTMIGKDYLLE